jgi:hypothetical protein
MFTIACAALLLWGFTRKDGGYQYPFLAGVMFTGWVLPQLWGLAGSPQLPDGAFTRVVLMSTLCAVACLAGYKSASGPLRGLDWSYSKQRLQQAAVALTLIGVVFQLLVDYFPFTRSGGQASGLSVALLFFAEIKKYGFVIAVMLFLRTRSKWMLAVAAVGAYFYVDSIVFGGRRAVASEFFFIIVLSVWFSRGKIIRPVFILLIAAVGVVGSFSIGEYRNALYDGDLTFKEVAAIEWVENVERTFQEGGGEMRAAAYQMAAISETAKYDFGVYHWNRLVFRYIPAQLLGQGFKNALFIDMGENRAVRLPQQRNDLTRRLYGFEKQLGLTVSGMTDAFASFGYLGFLKFFLISLVLAKIYNGARTGNLTLQILYPLLIVPAMHSVTHNTGWFLEAIPHMILFLFPALAYARLPVHTWRRAHAASH